MSTFPPIDAHQRARNFFAAALDQFDAGFGRCRNASWPPAAPPPPAAPTPQLVRGEAIVIEVRRLRRLASVLLNFRANLPRAWPITLLHGPSNGADIQSSAALRGHLTTGSVRLEPLPPSLCDASCQAPSASAFQAGANLTASAQQRAHSDARRWYNRYLKSAAFWRDRASAEHVLLFESDAVLCEKPTLPLEWWLGRYVYVGAPWSHQMGAGRALCKRLPCSCVGNSGLSLWRRPVLRLVCFGEGDTQSGLSRLCLRTWLSKL